MAGWTTALRALPWAELLAAAPVVVNGARKLWASVRQKEAAEAEGAWPEARLDALEAQVHELRKELAASSEVITHLAEQNARLVEAITILRMRARALFIACGILAVAIIGIAVAVFR